MGLGGVYMARKILIGTVVAAFVFMVAIGFLSRHHGERKEAAFFAMGGIPIRVMVYGLDKKEFNKAMQAVESRVESLENIFSRYREGSGIDRLNDAGSGCVEKLSPDLVNLIKRSKHWHEKSRGAFDVSVGPLVDLWKSSAKKGELPATTKISEARSSVGMQHVQIHDDRVCLNRNEMNFDLGAIAKGAILDEVAKVLSDHGAERGVVDAGGDVAAFGNGVFRVGIQDPKGKARGELIGVLTVPPGGVVTSGDYERYVTIDGKRYSHIIDPRTGMPVESLVSVTVVGPNATDADALATAISVMGKEEGIKLLAELSDYKAIMMEKNSEGNLSLWCSEDLIPLIEFSSGLTSCQ
jgi:thiamine biosynthesis lipoprotein